MVISTSIGGDLYFIGIKCFYHREYHSFFPGSLVLICCGEKINITPVILIKAICRESGLGIAWYIIHLTISRKGNLQTPYIFLAFFLVLYNDYDNNYWESPFMAWHTGHLYEWLAHYVEGREALKRKLNKWMIDHLKTYLS